MTELNVIVSLLLSLHYSTHSPDQGFKMKLKHTCCCQYLSLLCGFCLKENSLYFYQVCAAELVRSQQINTFQTSCVLHHTLRWNWMKIVLNVVCLRNKFILFNLMLVCCILLFTSAFCVCKRYIRSSEGQYSDCRQWLTLVICINDLFVGVKPL